MIGIVLLSSTLFLSSYLYSLRLIKKVKVLSEIVYMIEYISNQIQYNSLPVLELIHNLANDENQTRLSFFPKCVSLCKSGIVFPVSWKKTVASCNLPISIQDKEKLISIGDILGAYHSDTQISLLNTLKMHYKNSLLDATQEKTIKCKLYTSLGIWSSIGVWIILL